MAKKIVDRGLQVYAGRGSGTADNFAAIASMSVDDKADALADDDTSLEAPANQADADFVATPTRSGQEVSHTATFGIGVVLTIRRITLHNAAAAAVTGNSNTLVGGVDGQSINKTADYGLTLTLKTTLARPA